MKLDPRLERSSTLITTLELCDVRLSHNASFPWIVLIPRQDEISEIIDLSLYDQQVLMREICLASYVMKHFFHATKLNVASLGNIVPQLHVHIVARYDNDKAWPHPIWNSGIKSDYDSNTKIELIEKLKTAFYTHFI